MSYRAFSYWLVINPLFQQNFAAIKVYGTHKMMRFTYDTKPTSIPYRPHPCPHYIPPIHQQRWPRS